MASGQQQEDSSPTIMGQLRSKLRRMHPSMISDDGSENQRYINPEGLLLKKQKCNIYSTPQKLGLNSPVIEEAHIQPYAYDEAQRANIQRQASAPPDPQLAHNQAYISHEAEEVLSPYPNVPPLAAADAVVTQKKQKSSNFGVLCKLLIIVVVVALVSLTAYGIIYSVSVLTVKTPTAGTTSSLVSGGNGNYTDLERELDETRRKLREHEINAKHINKTQSELEQQILSRTSQKIQDLEEKAEGKLDTVKRQLESARSGLQSSLTNLNMTVSSDLHVVRGDINDAEESITELQSYHPATLGKLFLALSVENHWELTALQVTLHLIFLKIIAEP